MNIYKFLSSVFTGCVRCLRTSYLSLRTSYLRLRTSYLFLRSGQGAPIVSLEYQENPLVRLELVVDLTCDLGLDTNLEHGPGTWTWTLEPGDLELAVFSPLLLRP